MARIVILKRVGGSVMVAIPPTLLDAVNLAAGQQVMVSVKEGWLVIEARVKPRYTLQELLAQYCPSVLANEEGQSWTSSAAVGREEI